MQRKPKRRTRLSPKDLERLVAIVETLNATSPSGSHLRELVTMWQRSGPNTLLLQEQNPEVWDEVVEVWRNTTLIWPTNAGGAQNYTIRGPIGEDGELEKMGAGALRTKAVVLFITLLVSPAWDKLAGPCGRCGRYYLKRKASQTVYCSGQCGKANTAAQRTREKFQQERNEKITRVNAAIREWNKRRPAKAGDSDWKRWVAKRAKVDLRFITRARKDFTDVPKGA